MKKYDVEIEVFGKTYQATVKAFNEEGARLVAMQAIMKKIKVIHVCLSIDDKAKEFFETLFNK